MKDNEKCMHPRSGECFARTKIKEGKCTILKHTDFGYRECPFFKTDAEYEAGIRKWGDGRDYIATHSIMQKDKED